MRRQGCWTFSRAIRFGREKGIDVRIALDVVGCALDRAYDVALVFSQDQDLAEVADEIRKIARQQDRWIKIASAFPLSETSRNRRGINQEEERDEENDRDVALSSSSAECTSIGVVWVVVE